MDAFKINKVDNDMVIERLIYPRFTAKITFGHLSDIEDIVMIDDCKDIAILAKVMREAGEYIIKSSKK